MHTQPSQFTSLWGSGLGPAGSRDLGRTACRPLWIPCAGGQVHSACPIEFDSLGFELCTLGQRAGSRERAQDPPGPKDSMPRKPGTLGQFPQDAAHEARPAGQSCFSRHLPVGGDAALRDGVNGCQNALGCGVV